MTTSKFFQNAPFGTGEITAPAQRLTYAKTLLFASIVGVVGGLVATAYYFVLENCLEAVWEVGKLYITGFFPAWLPAWNYTWMVATLGGLGGLGLARDAFIFWGNREKWRS